jgi:putative transposase
LTLEEKRAVVEPRHPAISLRRQCELLDLPRSSLYYRGEADCRYNEQLMRLLDEQYLRTPFYGVPRMTAWLRRQGHVVNEKRVRRLLRVMGLEAIYPRRKQGLSQADRQHKVYPSPTCCEIWRSRVPTKSGPPTSRTFGWRAAGCI